MRLTKLQINEQIQEWYHVWPGESVNDYPGNTEAIQEDIAASHRSFIWLLKKLIGDPDCFL